MEYTSLVLVATIGIGYVVQWPHQLASARPPTVEAAAAAAGSKEEERCPQWGCVVRKRETSKHLREDAFRIGWTSTDSAEGSIEGPASVHQPSTGLSAVAASPLYQAAMRWCPLLLVKRKVRKFSKGQGPNQYCVRTLYTTIHTPTDRCPNLLPKRWLAIGSWTWSRDLCLLVFWLLQEDEKFLHILLNGNSDLF